MAGSATFSPGRFLDRLTGGPPSVGVTVADVGEQINVDFHPPVGFGPRVFADLRTTVANALASSLSARCGSAAAFAAELRAVAAILDLRRGACA